MNPNLKTFLDANPRCPYCGDNYYTIGGIQGCESWWHMMVAGHEAED